MQHPPSVCPTDQLTVRQHNNRWLGLLPWVNIYLYMYIYIYIYIYWKMNIGNRFTRKGKWTCLENTHLRMRYHICHATWACLLVFSAHRIAKLKQHQSNMYKNMNRNIWNNKHLEESTTQAMFSATFARLSHFLFLLNNYAPQRALASILSKPQAL